MMYITNPQRESDYGARWSLLLIGMMASMLVLVGRAVDLQVVDRQFLKHQGVSTGAARRTIERGRQTRVGETESIA